MYQFGMEPPEDRSSNAVRVWMPLSVISATITFVIAFVMRIPQKQTIAASALPAVIVFSGLPLRSYGKVKAKYGK
jgi:hypothetical protein